MPNLFGTAPNQAPTNGDLGTLAFQDANAVKITGGEVTAVQKTDTAISETNPSLNLDFANTKSLDPRITFTRNTTATYYDGKTMAKAEQNLMLYSEQFDNAGGWTALRASVIGNAAIAPDGSTTADYLSQLTGQTTSGAVYPADASFQALPYVFSVYAKPNGKNFIRVASTVATGSLAGCYFNVSTGAVGTADVGIVGSISAAANGYYRCIIAFTADAARTGSNRIFVADADNSSTVTDSGGVFIWGAQLEQRSAVSSYTPTTSSPVTNYIPALQTCPVNSARFDHDPITGESKGLLIEEQRTNLLTYSEQFDNAAWTKASVSISSNIIVAPDGTMSGDKIVENTSTSGHGIYQAVSKTAAAITYTASGYAKAAERYILQVLIEGTTAGSSGSATFDLYNGTYSLVGASGGFASASANIYYVGNGWYRYYLTATSNTDLIAYSTATLKNSAGSNNYTGDGKSGIYIWGAQLEAGAFPTSYIPTVASQVTRSADSATMTGTNFSSWFRADQGTFSLSASTSVVGSPNFPRFFWARGSDSLNSISALQLRAAGQFGANVTTSNVSQGDVTVNGLTANTFFNGVLSYATNDLSVSFNGSAVATDTSVILPVMNTFEIGNVGGTGQMISGHIKRIAYYPKRLSNDELVEMTS